MVPDNEDKEGAYIYIPDKVSRAVSVTIVAGLLGGTGISTWQLLSPEGRADPYTGSEGRELTKRVEKLERRMDYHELEHRLKPEGHEHGN